MFDYIYYNRRKIIFNNQLYVTLGVDNNVPIELQFFMWETIRDLSEPRYYLQIFEFDMENDVQTVIHKQEDPTYTQIYKFKGISKNIKTKVYVIDDETYSRMLLASEY